MLVISGGQTRPQLDRKLRGGGDYRYGMVVMYSHSMIMDNDANGASLSAAASSSSSTEMHSINVNV